MTTGSEWTAIGIAAVGAATGVTSLAMQFLGQRTRVEVKASWGLAAFVPGVASGIISVEARNKGRAEVEAVGWGLFLPDGQRYIVPYPAPGSASLPASINPAHHKTWIHEVAHATVLLQLNATAPVELVPYVDLGTGSTIRGRPLRMDAGGLQALLGS